MPKMRLGWYAGVRDELQRLARWHMTANQITGVNSHGGWSCPVGVPEACQLLFGYGISITEQLLLTGTHPVHARSPLWAMQL